MAHKPNKPHYGTDKGDHRGKTTHDYRDIKQDGIHRERGKRNKGKYHKYNTYCLEDDADPQKLSAGGKVIERFFRHISSLTESSPQQ